MLTIAVVASFSFFGSNLMLSFQEVFCADSGCAEEQSPLTFSRVNAQFTKHSHMRLETGSALTLSASAFSLSN
jgi:hypothetical protein